MQNNRKQPLLNQKQHQYYPILNEPLNNNYQNTQPWTNHNNNYSNQVNPYMNNNQSMNNNNNIPYSNNINQANYNQYNQIGNHNHNQNANLVNNQIVYQPPFNQNQYNINQQNKPYVINGQNNQHIINGTMNAGINQNNVRPQVIIGQQPLVNGQPLMPNVNQCSIPCKMCGYDGISTWRKSAGSTIYSWCLCLFCFTGIGFWIPFCCNNCYDTDIICSRCAHVKSKVKADCC